MAYAIVAFALTVLFLIRLIQIGNLFLDSKKYRWNECVVADRRKPNPTFSFFNFIFIGHASRLTAGEREEVLVHERVHVRKLHSFDIILINLLGIAFWFNPVVRIYKKSPCPTS